MTSEAYMVNGGEHDLWKAVNEIRDDVADIKTDVAVLRTEYNERQPRCSEHEARLRVLADWVHAHEVAGRPPSRAAVLFVSLLGQLIVGIGVVVAVVRLKG